MMPRYAARRDTVEPALLNAVKRCGGYWLKAPPLDGWVWHPRTQEWLLVEIKDPSKEGHKDEFTEKQKELLADFEVRRIKLHVWRTQDDVIRDLGGRS